MDSGTHTQPCNCGSTDCVMNHRDEDNEWYWTTFTYCETVAQDNVENLASPSFEEFRITKQYQLHNHIKPRSEKRKKMLVRRLQRGRNL